MKAIINLQTILILISLCSLLSGCTSFTLPAQALDTVIHRDLTILDDTLYSPEIARRIANVDVLMLGENHNQIEHQQLLASWAIQLHAQGVRQVLLECYQLFDWIMNAYVMGEIDTLPRYLQIYYGKILTPIRDFNLTLPAEERIQVHAIDINHDPQAYFTSLQQYAQTLSQPDRVTSFLDQVIPEDSKIASQQVEQFYKQLQSQENELRTAWGEAAYDTVLRMTWMQLQTYPIRAIWNSRNNQATRMREEVIKKLVDRYLQGEPGKTIINMGGNHIQLDGRLGTRQEWLGEYLAKHSPYVAGKTYAVYVMIYRGEHDDGNGNQSTFDLDETSPKNELFRSMHAVAGRQSAFLPLEDEIFTHRVAVNYRSVIRGFPPREVYDAYVLIPEGHVIHWQ